MSVHRLQTTGWINLSTLTSLDFTLNSIKLTNLSNGALYVTRSATIPADSFTGAEIFPKETYSFIKNALQTWIRAPFLGVIDVDLLLASSIEPFTSVDLPSDVWTTKTEEYRRLRVDVGQTGFFEGREFRTFKELSIASGATLVMRIIVPVNTILQNVRLSLDAGSVKLRTVVGGTPTGTFSEALPIIPKNTMTGSVFPAPPLPLYTAQNTVGSGATALTGGVDIDVIRIVVANASGQAQSVGASVDDSRGVGPGTYYWIFNNFGSGTATGVFSSFWEERP